MAVLALLYRFLLQCPPLQVPRNTAEGAMDRTTLQHPFGYSDSDAERLSDRARRAMSPKGSQTQSTAEIKNGFHEMPDNSGNEQLQGLFRGPKPSDRLR